MSVLPGWWEQHRAEHMNAELPETGLFARIEGLVGEEHALLRVPEHERTHEQHERLRSIGRELDRAWERLRERALRLGGPSAPAAGIN
jgi:hypothetical protein